MSAILRLKSIPAVLIIIVLGILIYAHSIGNAFIGDDNPQIVENPMLHSLDNIGSFFTSSTFDNGGALTGVYYKPLMTTSFAVIYSLFGANPTPFHIFQIAIHILNAILVFYIFKYFFSKNLSLFLALIFLVSPINSEAVLYIAALQDTLFLFFGLISLITLQKTKSEWAVILSALFLFLALLSKETAILFVPITLIFSWFYQRKRLIFLVPAAALVTVIYGYMKFKAVGLFPSSVYSPAPIAHLPVAERLLNIPSLIWFYLHVFFFPIHLASSYHFYITGLDFTRFFLPLILSIIFFGGLFFLGFRLKDKSIEKVFWFFLIWFILSLGLHLQIFPLDQTAAERWFYLPSVGILGFLGALIANFHLKNQKLVLAAAIVIIGILSLRTFVRTLDWKDEFTLDSHDIQYSKEAYELEGVLAYLYLQQGKTDEALAHAQRSVQLFPYITNYNNLGLAYLQKGDIPNAEAAYKKAIALAPYYLPYQNLSGLLMAYGDPKEAEQFNEKALARFPNNADLWLYQAIIKYKLNKIDEAKQASVRAYSLRQDSQTGYLYTRLENNQPLELNFNTKMK